MALQPIPGAWLRRVAQVLKSGTMHREIRKTQDFSQKFQASFPSDTDDRVLSYFLIFLESRNPHGCPVNMNRPPGDTWEFWFTYKQQKTYGKILLSTDQQRVILFSAHLPERRHLRCEQEQ